MIGADCIGSCKSNYNAITITTASMPRGQYKCLKITHSIIFCHKDRRQKNPKILKIQKLTQWRSQINSRCHRNNVSQTINCTLASVVRVWNPDWLYLLLCIFNPLCRGTIRQYVEQVLRLWTVLVFPPPLEFSCAHIYSEVLLTHNSHKIIYIQLRNYDS